MNFMPILINLILVAGHCCWFNHNILGWHKAICLVSETSIEWIFDMFCYFGLLFVFLILHAIVRGASVEAF